MSATDSLRHRGWSLVDLTDARYANKGNRYIYVCRLREPQSTALQRFRAIVDEAEGE